MAKCKYQTLKGHYYLVPVEEEIVDYRSEKALLKTLKDLKIPLDVSTAIRILRGGLGLSKKNFCSKVGISRATLNRWESIECKLSTPTKRKLSEAFGKPFLEFIELIEFLSKKS